MEWLLEPEALIALVTLTVLEIVLGIDNVVFISILAGKLPPEQRGMARRTGLALAMFLRIGMLAGLGWLAGLTAPLLTVLGNELSGRDFILITGGLFLLAKATYEIHHKLEDAPTVVSVGAAASLRGTIVQILALDVVFSLDSVITAIGMAQHLAVMVTAVVLAVVFMMAFAGTIGDFVDRHPTVKMLALAFLLLIGMALVADGLDQHIPKGYIYFAMGFSVFVEFLNLRVRSRHASPGQTGANLATSG